MRETRRTYADAGLAAVVVAIVGMMIVPLPTPFIDGLIAINLTFGVLLLATALFMRDALSFAAFPTLLVIATLYRLSLNVSSTRLILLQADAGRIIEAFGRFVVRGDYAVGAMVFAVITLVQFLVIARGAERVAEVGARFSLDAMPGKQLAIDAELRAGTLGAEAARAARKRLERESQLYGAMDGAMKFVKGDAVAGLVITAINFVGGVALGATTRGLALTESLEVYGLLTVGDGLVTQIPSLLGSTAAAIAVTRVASEDERSSLAAEIGAQLFGDPRALAVAALVLTAVALLPSTPAWPFVVLAGGCTLLGLRARRGRAHAGREQIGAEPPKIALALGPELAQTWFPRGQPTRELLEALDSARSHARMRWGLPLGPVVVVADGALAGRTYQLRFRGLPGPSSDRGPPHDGPPLAKLTLDVAEGARRRAEVCLTLRDVQGLLDQLETTEPELVRRLPANAIPLSTLTQVLRTLLREGVSIRGLTEILEALDSPAAPRDRDPTALAEHVRGAIHRHIAHSVAPGGSLHVLRLDPSIEEALLDALTEHADGVWLALPPDLAQDIEDAIARGVERAPEPKALVTGAPLRRHVRSLIAHRLPDLAVLGARELSPELRVAGTHVISA